MSLLMAGQLLILSNQVIMSLLDGGPTSHLCHTIFSLFVSRSVHFLIVFLPNNFY